MQYSQQYLDYWTAGRPPDINPRQILIVPVMGHITNGRRAPRQFVMYYGPRERYRQWLWDEVLNRAAHLLAITCDRIPAKVHNRPRREIYEIGFQYKAVGVDYYRREIFVDVGLFQYGYHIDMPPSLDLLEWSIGELALQANANPEIQYKLPCITSLFERPEQEAGLKMHLVLPDNVILYGVPFHLLPNIKNSATLAQGRSL